MEKCFKRRVLVKERVRLLEDRIPQRDLFLQVVEPPKITGYEGFDPGLYQNELEELTRQAKSYMDSQEDKFRKKGFDCRSRTDMLIFLLSNYSS